jgi:type I restriction enzyme S subunit
MNELDLGDVAFISEVINSEMQRSIVAKDDVLLNITGASIGRVARFGLSGVRANVNQHVCIIRPLPDKLESRYLTYFLSSPQVQHDISNRHQHGGTRQALTFSQIADFQIPLPPLRQQKRIADILDKADGIRRKRREASKLAGSITQSMFFDRYRTFFREHRSDVLVPMEKCCERITDGVHITPTYVNHGVPFLRITDIKNGSIDWTSVKKIPREEYLEITKRTRPSRGDVLYSKNGTIGIPIEVTWDHEFAHFVSLARLSPKRDLLDPSFLTTFLGTDLALRQATSHSKTLTVTNLHLVDIRKILIPCPDLSEQRSFVRDATRISQACINAASAVSTAESLFNSLVQRAFRGEL